MKWLIFAPLVVLASARAAYAQNRDFAFEVGAQKRFLTDRQGKGDDAGVGPTAMASAHLGGRLLRGGLYLGAEYSPMNGDEPGRLLISGGLHLKAISPIPLGPLHFYCLTGLGYVFDDQLLGQAPSGYVPFNYDHSLPELESAGGHYFEVPLGVGAWWVRQEEWSFIAELTLRFGFGHDGSAYKRGSELTDYSSIGGRSYEGIYPPYGDDRWAIGLSIGVLYDE